MIVPQTDPGTTAQHNYLKRLERVKGIEPSSSAWKAVALPLSYTRTAPPNALPYSEHLRLPGKVGACSRSCTTRAAIQVRRHARR